MICPKVESLKPLTATAKNETVRLSLTKAKKGCWDRNITGMASVPKPGCTVPQTFRSDLHVTARHESRAKNATTKEDAVLFSSQAERNITFQTLTAARALASEPQEALGIRPKTKATAKEVRRDPPVTKVAKHFSASC